MAIDMASSASDLAVPSGQSCPEAPRRGERAIEETPAAGPFLEFLRQELAPYPGRGVATLRIVIGCVVVLVLCMTLRVPEAYLAVWAVVRMAMEESRKTLLTGAVMLLALTIGLALPLALLPVAFDQPALRLCLMAAMAALGLFLRRTFVIGALGFVIGLVGTMVMTAPDFILKPEQAVRFTLWLWLVFALGIGAAVATTLLIAPAAGAPDASKSHAGHGRLFVPDALTNPEYVRYALKGTLAVMICYTLQHAVNWPGIRTCLITCLIVALGTEEATVQKGTLRVAGALVGAAMGFLAIMLVIPSMESITSLTLLVAAGTAIAAWVTLGSPRISYAGVQIAFAFYVCVIQGFAPTWYFYTIRDRLVGILLGNAVITLVFHYLWPERAVGVADVGK